MGHLHRDPTETSGAGAERPSAGRAGRAVPAGADVALAPLLAGPPRTGRVVIVTPLAVYTRLDEGERLVALLGAGAVRVPDALVVAGGWPTVAARAPAGAAVLVGGGALAVGGVRIRPSRWFEALVPRVPLTGPPPEAARLGLPPLPDVVRTEAGAFAAALGDGDEARLARAVGELVGLGPGLTPAGDDVLAGALVALAATGGDVDGLDRLVAPLRSRTTVVSAALLRCAAAGRAVPQLARFVVAAAGGGEQAVVQDLLRVGSTSGAALAHGVLAALGAPVGEVA